jgi:hydrogenase large subunit
LKNIIKLIEKIEGEAKLNFSFDNQDKIDYVDIEFLTTRNIEKILENKPALDALVINPRVCGICGQAHLICTVQALEDCYDDIQISNKAKILRELTLNFELIANHFKWFYLNLLPLFGKKQYILKATRPSTIMSKAIATIAGQYPHTSYAIVGGVVSDITNMDLIKVKSYINETLKYFEDMIVQANTTQFKSCTNIDELLSKDGDLPDLLKEIKNKKWQNIGKSYDRFIVFGQTSYFSSGKSNKTKVSTNISIDNVKLYDNTTSKAKNVMYKDKYFEVGPLSRAMLNKTPLIKDSHRKYADSMFSRILARTCEIPQLLHHCVELINQIDLNEPSYIKPSLDISKLTGNGQSAVEAARGSLIHKVILKNGIIQKYDIITPTQWNLSNGTKLNPATSQKAMLGLKNINLAQIVFKSFDVCSVCTTH